MPTDGDKRCVDVGILHQQLLGLFGVIDVVDVDGDEAGVFSECIVLSSRE